MKIDGFAPLPENSVPAGKQQAKQAAAKNRPEDSLGVQDETRLSVEGKKTQSLQSELAKLPEVRRDRIEALQRAVQDGSYQVSDEQIADAMISELLP